MIVPVRPINTWRALLKYLKKLELDKNKARGRIESRVAIYLARSECSGCAKRARK